MLEVFFHAMEDLDGRRGRRLQPRNAVPLEQHLGHLLTTDPATAYVGEDRGRVVAFGVVMRRGEDAFLSFLFVEPAWQGRRLGRAVLEACLRPAQAARIATCVEADQPVSTGLYASLGMAPLAPLYLLRGSIPDGALPSLPEDVRPRPLLADAAASIDRSLLGYARPQDHALWAQERHGALFVAGNGEVLGYGYAHRSGRVGPVAARDPGALAGFIGYLLRSTPVLEGRQLIVPGHAIGVLRALLAAGVRIDGTPAIYCSAGPGPRFDRYIPMSFALL